MDNDLFFNYMENSIRWRYLDSLDSLRLAEEFAEGLELPRRKIHAKPMFFLTILMGHGIVVPENQLVDSIAFIPYASDLIRAINTSGVTFFTPIRLAYYRSPNPFEIAAKIFEDNGFFMSGWPLLQKDNQPRRQEWATFFRKKRNSS